MKSFIWIAINLIGFFILVFMYTRREKTSEKTMSQRLIEYLKISIMVYLVLNTIVQILDGAVFEGGYIINYISNVALFITTVLPGFIYLIYCDDKVFAGAGNVKRRILLYSIPVAVNTLISLSTPFTHTLFYINEFNTYVRGEFFWISMAISFGYVLLTYPLLAINTKNKPALPPKGVNLYFYLFPVPPVIMAIIQLMNREFHLVGIGFVVSVFIIYLASIQSLEDKRSLSVRFFNINVIQFAIIAFVMTVGVLLVLDNVTEEISMDYAEYNSVSTVNLFEAYINKEIGIIGAAAGSKVITEWFSDENDALKKQDAFDEFINVLRMLYSDNLYLFVDESNHAYVVDENSSGFSEPLFVDDDDPENEWYIELLNSPYDYVLNVDVDNISNRKAVWLNFKIFTNDKDVAGALAVGMDLSGVAERVFDRFDNSKFRGFIIDENGVVQMDSSLIGDSDVLMHGEIKTIFEEVNNPEFHEALREYLGDFPEDIHELNKETQIVNFQSGQHSYATITPISSTHWSVIMLYDSSSLFDITKLLPLLIILAIVFILFTYSTNRIARRLIFTPINNLVDSLIRKRNNKEQDLYGMDRNDEIGLLSNTIQEYYVTGYYDGLTGIYNRRYFEMTLQQIMNTLSRTESKLSIMMMDVDFFKKYNDTYGHAEGDNCLKSIAETLGKSMQRKGDFAARYGGEEFVVVLPGTDEDGAKIVAENILSSIRGLQIPHEKNDSGNFVVTISIGITTGTGQNSQNGADYLKKADEALYLAKEAGRNRYSFLEM